MALQQAKFALALPLLLLLGLPHPALANELLQETLARSNATLGTSLKWSGLSASGRCSSGPCTVPAGETWILDASMNVQTLSIFGNFVWDTSRSDLELRAGYVYVGGNGRLEIGTEANPMLNRATVYITKNSEVRNSEVGSRFLAGEEGASIELNGRPLPRTWTLLTQTASSGSDVLHLKHDPQAMGWRVGDRVGIATTKRGWASVHTVTALGPHTVLLKERLADEHWGGWKEIKGYRFEMAAEVVNLERSITITGDHDDFEDTKHGLHTMIAGWGYMAMRYTRVEYCGQRDVIGRYCLHFHLMDHCPRCVFKGNAVHESQQNGIVVHGTHDSLVEENIIFDAVGTGIYIEDGNEMNNMVRRNVMICSWFEKCSEQWLGQPMFAGIFMIGMTNDIIENRVAGYENGIWTPGAFRGLGFGMATNRACPQFTPFGIMRGNVYHDCWRFGLYLDNQHPRKVKRDYHGFLTDHSSCQPWTADGEDNGVVNVVEDEFDWHNMFVGGYDMGDLQFVNYTSVNNAHGMYWKTSKDFADGRLYHFKDSLFVNEPGDRIGLGQLQLFGPAGPFAFGIANTAFVGGPTGLGAICAGQACGLGGAGGPCNVQYLLHQVDFSRIEPGNRILKFGVHSIDQGYVLPMFMADDNSLGGHHSIVSRHLHGFGAVAGCQRLGNEYDQGYACSRSVRRLNVWGRRSDPVQLTGPGLDASPPNMDAPVHGIDSGLLQYEPANGKAYGVPVLAGETYQLSGQWDGDIVVEFSDPAIGLYFQEPDESVRVQVGGVICELRASDDRRYLGPKGPVQRVLNTHTSIRGGQLLCGGPQHPHALSVPPCSRLSDVERMCSTTEGGCRVLTASTPGRTCANYCAQAGLASTGAWEEKPGTCKPERPLGTSEVLSGSSNLLCECSEVAPIIVNITSKPRTTVPLSRFPECTTMRGVEKVCSKSGCQVLVSAKSCSDYCQANNLACVGAWQPTAHTCSAQAHLECDQISLDAASSSLICECELPVPSTRRSSTASAIRSFSVTTNPMEVKAFHIVMKEGQCLQASDVKAATAFAHTARCNTTDPRQRWNYNEATHQLRNELGACLEAVAGRRVAAVECDAPKMAQRWGRKGHSGHIRNKEQGVCLEAVGRDLLLVWECSSKTRGQRWDFATLPKQAIE